ncbi:MAG: hypothetical protein F6K00_15045 [Leptolyngbya sp. SIOISBB]|nr:hypothetical protein [Leptolyngbya sp. SIOISBB]
MNGRIIKMGVALTASYLAFGTAAAIAQNAFPSQELLAESVAESVDAAAEADSEPAPFEAFVVPGQFALEIPTGWTTQVSASEDMAIITNYDRATSAPALTDIKTEITVVAEPPDVYVSRELDSLIEQALAGAYEIDRYGITSIGGKEAFRIWMVQLPGDFAQQAITFVGDGQGSTAKIVSSYNDDSPATKDLILHMHGSFDFVAPGE